jgi:hypothetical protein
MQWLRLSGQKILGLPQFVQPPKQLLPARLQLCFRHLRTMGW